MNILALDDFLKQSLREDIGFGDITTEAVCEEGHISGGTLIAKQDLVLAGMVVFERAITMLDDKVEIVRHFSDGELVRKGQEIARLSGSTRAILMAERVALNLLQRLSGIATQTRQYVDALRGYETVIVDTRKTTPGLRMLEKYAVTVGGGKNHRFSLDAMVLIKDNHIRAAGGIIEAVKLVRSKVSPFLKIEVEAETLEQVREALKAGVDVIMLDNMTSETITQAVAIISGQALVEVSGNVTLNRLPELASNRREHNIKRRVDPLGTGCRYKPQTLLTLVYDPNVRRSRDLLTDRIKWRYNVS